MILHDTAASGASDEEDGRPLLAADNEREGLQNNYSVLHLILCSASLYTMVALTNWHSPDAAVGQDQLQLGLPPPLRLDPCGSARPHQSRLQLKFCVPRTPLKFIKVSFAESSYTVYFCFN